MATKETMEEEKEEEEEEERICLGVLKLGKLEKLEERDLVLGSGSL
jgi:hypothetical protein